LTAFPKASFCAVNILLLISSPVLVFSTLSSYI
jgi:hypothetical protein